MRSLMVGFALTVLYAAIPPAAADAVVSTFEDGDEGWRVIELVATPPNKDYRTVRWGPVSPDWNSAGGCPSAHILYDDVAGWEAYFEAPAKFLGDKSDMYGGQLSWCARNEPGGSFEAADVVLLSPDMVLVNDDPAQATPDWQTFSAPLLESDGWHVDTESGRAPTQLEFESVLGNLTGLRIRGEYVSGAETGYLDSVYLVPEPATLSLFALGGLALALRRR